MTPVSPDRPGVIAPPPLIYLAGAGLGWGMQQWLPLHLLPHRAWWLGGTLIFLACGLALWAVYSMKSAGTHIDPSRPAIHLVQRGPYRWTRNPIYLSLTGVTVGGVLIDNNVWILLLLVPVLVVMQTAVIRREERYLERKFQDEYRDYMKQVRRWL